MENSLRYFTICWQESDADGIFGGGFFMSLNWIMKEKGRRSPTKPHQARKRRKILIREKEERERKKIKDLIQNYFLQFPSEESPLHRVGRDFVFE